MKKKKIFIIIFAFFMVITITGCDTKEKKEYDVLRGQWKASIEHQNVYQTGPNEERIGGKEEYILNFDGNGNYSISDQKKEFAKGSYTILDNAITFKDDGNMVIGLCKLIDNKELDCSEKSQYAFKYIRVK